MPSITIRNVPEETRNELAARAAGSGRSLQEYLRGELINMASKPDAATLMKRIRERVEREGIEVDAETILAWRDSGRR
ncbi:MAG: hypothetical protein EXR66_09360 [Dehalococcoidia bacterium]|nr:hypothetical protein [Dehalococcoidia bacterium]